MCRRSAKFYQNLPASCSINYASIIFPPLLQNNIANDCNTAVCEDGDVRLVGGATEREGRLEVCFGRRWGTIDGHGWTHIDTQVACRQLGHSAAST